MSKLSSLPHNSSRFETELTRKNGIKSSTSSELQYGSFKLNLKKDVIVCRVIAGNVGRLPDTIDGAYEGFDSTGTTEWNIPALFFLVCHSFQLKCERFQANEPATTILFP